MYRTRRLSPLSMDSIGSAAWASRSGRPHPRPSYRARIPTGAKRGKRSGGFRSGFRREISRDTVLCGRTPRRPTGTKRHVRVDPGSTRMRPGPRSSWLPANDSPERSVKTRRRWATVTAFMRPPSRNFVVRLRFHASPHATGVFDVSQRSSMHREENGTKATGLRRRSTGEGHPDECRMNQNERALPAFRRSRTPAARQTPGRAYLRPA
jgi:hypothetical protein